MIKRANVVLVLYDLPVKDAKEKRIAVRFHKELLKLGYMFVQKSVYAKIVHNRSSIQTEITNVKDIAPIDGVVNMLRMSLEDFKKMYTISGDGFDMRLFADEIVEL